MSRPFNLPISVHPVVLGYPQTTNGGFTSAVCTLKHSLKAWLYIYLQNAVGFAQVLTPMQATTIAAGTNAVIPAVPIWANEDVGASDTLVAQTPGANYTTAAVAKKKLVVFEIDPAILTDGYPCVYVILSNSAQATNFATVVAHLWQTNAVATPPSSILD
jgi:hypothetical protein